MKSNRMRWEGNVNMHDTHKKLDKIFVRKPVGKNSLRRPRCRWEDNIRMDLREIGLEGVDYSTP
jgi:hypothetical protein